jgi:uncharacterized membrane protein SpoIIM required for sporulation
MVKIFLTLKNSSEKNRQEDNLKDKFFKIKFTNLLIYVFILICLTLDFIVVINPNLDLREFLQNFKEYENNKLVNMLITIKDKYQFLPLMLFSVINSIVVQILIIINLLRKN